jgi:hypothetical protein
MSKRKIKRFGLPTRETEPEIDVRWVYQDLSHMWAEYGELLGHSNKEDKEKLAANAFAESADYMRNAIEVIEAEIVNHPEFKPTKFESLKLFAGDLHGPPKDLDDSKESE